MCRCWSLVWLVFTAFWLHPAEWIWNVRMSCTFWAIIEQYSSGREHRSCQELIWVLLKSTEAHSIMHSCMDGLQSLGRAADLQSQIFKAPMCTLLSANLSFMCVFQSKRRTLSSSLCRWPVRRGTLRRPHTRSGSCGSKPSRARSLPACSRVRA